MQELACLPSLVIPSSETEAGDGRFLVFQGEGDETANKTNLKKNQTGSQPAAFRLKICLACTVLTHMQIWIYQKT
jgi:hypothetical protein